MPFHLAQVNIARMRNSIDHAGMVGLASQIEEMNQLAERSQGFIWRLLGSEATPDAFRAKPGVDRLIRIDYHGAKEVPTGTCQAILKAAGLSTGKTA